MKIVIPSSGRASIEQQHTLEQLRGTGNEVALVVQKPQATFYKPIADHFGVELVVLPKGIEAISPTRQWILDQHKSGKFCFMDDDLTFFKRRTDDKTKFLKATVTDRKNMIKTIERTLDKYAHVGVLGREGGNRITVPLVECTRMMRVLAYDAGKVHKVGARFDRIVFKQDFDMTLQLLRAGYRNAVIASYVQDQVTSNAPGGCSVYRTEDKNVQASQMLKALHPDFVRVVQKETKGAWGGGTRTDVQIQWKKAFEESQHVA